MKRQATPAQLRALQKGRDRLAQKVHEQAQAIIDRIDPWEDLGDKGVILDHLCPSIIGKARNSPIVRNWIVKLVREGLKYREHEIEYRGDEFERWAA